MTAVLPPFEKDLARASTLDARAYTDPEIFALERERIWARTWQPVGRVDQVKAPGDFFTCEVAGEPIVVTRGKDGDLRAFYNVCRHRAGPVAFGAGNKKSLTCRYHGWTYALDGKLVATPEFDGVQGFDKACNGLRAVAVTAWGPFVFVNLDAASPSLESFLGAIPDETAPYDLASMRSVERRDYVINCNWKVYVDNYLEGYHLPVVHPALYRELDYDEYRIETFRWYSAQRAPIRPRNTAGERQYDEAGSALYYWVFPSWMINIYPDNMSINIVVPLGVDRTLTLFEWFFKDPDGTPREAMARSLAFSDQIQQEDITICEAVQKRLGSRAYERGRFSVRRENGVHHFQGLVHEALTRP